MFYCSYGTMIHTGIDFDFIPIHGQKWLNTPYHHHVSFYTFVLKPTI